MRWESKLATYDGFMASSETKGDRRRQRSRGASCALGLSTIFQSAGPPSEMVAVSGAAPDKRCV